MTVVKAQITTSGFVQPIGFYDAEAHFGVVPNDPSIGTAKANIAKINPALAATWIGGNYRVVGGTSGPILKPIKFGTGEYFIHNPGMIFDHRIGGEVQGVSGGKTDTGPSSNYANAINARGSLVSRITRSWESADSSRPYRPVAIMGGNGQDFGKATINGRRWIIGVTYVGDQATSGIDCESRDFSLGSEQGPPCGFHYIHDMTIQECQVGIRAMKGYYTVVNGELVFHEYESNCDQCTVERVAMFGGTDFFKCENQQAVGWAFRDLSINMVDGNDFNVFNIARGGNVTADTIVLNHRQVYLYRQGSGDQNTSCSFIHGVKWDLGVNLPGKFLCLYKWDGGVWDDMSDVTAALEVTGHWTSRDPGSFDATKIIQVPRGKNFPLQNIRIKMIGMPTDHFIDIGGGFYTPDPAYWAN